MPFLLSVAAGRGRLVHPQPGRGEPRLSRSALEEAEAPPKLPALDVFRERPKAVVLGAGLRVGENISYYILTVFSLTFLVDVAAESRSLALNALLIGAAVQFFAIPLFARALRPDRPAPGLCVRRASAWPPGASPCSRCWRAATTRSIVLALVVGLVLHGAMYGPQAAMIAELFPTRIRYSGASIAYQLTAIFAGSLAPIIALWLYQRI